MSNCDKLDKLNFLVDLCNVYEIRKISDINYKIDFYAKKDKTYKELYGKKTISPIDLPNIYKKIQNENDTDYYEKILYSSKISYDDQAGFLICIDSEFPDTGIDHLCIVGLFEIIKYATFSLYSSSEEILNNLKNNEYILHENRLKNYLKKEIRNEICGLSKKNKKLEQRVEKLEKLLNNMLCYSPDAPGYDKAEKEFNELK